ncbi:MAG: hypothetical protein EA421_11945 [Gemmatimonadales bacterium]|nr:MAG: hypothetical protein EA421_11945 [Gemmatimonadales bacterium]
MAPEAAGHEGLATWASRAPAGAARSTLDARSARPGVDRIPFAGEASTGSRVLPGRITHA